MNIHFGTSGRRAVVAEEFTLADVGVVSQAISDEFKLEAPQKPVIVDHDTHFLGEELAAKCAQIIANQGFRTLICEGPKPTPAVSHAIRSERAVCAINFTASHNPPEYNGMKLSTADGAPALPAVTQKIEARLGGTAKGQAAAPSAGICESHDPSTAYLEDLETKVRFDLIARAKGSYAYDALWGIGELINEDKIIVGGEESAGLSIKGHCPKKDGILACLLAAEAVAARGASLTEELNALFANTGRLESGRIGVRLTRDLIPKLKEKLKEEPNEQEGRRVKTINRTDGLKLIFEDDSWVLVRPSGTEPLVRIYAESESEKDVEVLLEQGRKYLLG
jgi:phosphomannomutase